MASVMRFDEWQDSNGVPVLDGSGGGLALGKILQVVQVVKSDTFSTSSTTYVDVTGLSATITPSATSSKVLVITNPKVGPPSGNVIYTNLVRDSTAIFTGTAAGSRDNQGQGAFYSGANQTINGQEAIFLDSPATTSATTYKIQIKVQTGGTGHLNRTDTDTDNAQFLRTASSITLMEVAG